MAISFTACKSVDNTSKTKYGFVEKQSYLFINIKPGETIRVCGDTHFNLVEKSIQKWGEAIHRSFKVEESCDDPHVRMHGYEDDETKEICEENGLHNRMAVQYNDRPDFWDCDKSPNLVPFSVLHEVGHLFGMCDQYDAGLVGCKMYRQPADGSVMRSATTLDLMPDDILGIRVLACMTNYPANAEWAKNLSVKMAQWPDVAKEIKAFEKHTDEYEFLSLCSGVSEGADTNDAGDGSDADNSAGTTTFAKWSTGEPDIGNREENCAAMLTDGTWADRDCDDRKQFACQSEANLLQWTLTSSKAPWSEGLIACPEGMVFSVPATDQEVLALRKIMGTVSIWINLTDIDQEGTFVKK